LIFFKNDEKDMLLASKHYFSPQGSSVSDKLHLCSWCTCITATVTTVNTHKVLLVSYQASDFFSYFLSVIKKKAKTPTS